MSGIWRLSQKKSKGKIGLTTILSKHLKLDPKIIKFRTKINKNKILKISILTTCKHESCWPDSERIFRRGFGKDQADNVKIKENSTFKT